MSINAFSTNLISTLGNPSSTVPLLVKDTVNALGSVEVSKKASGNIEAQDRLIDEFGTQAVWIFGLPIFKFAFDKIAYKFAKLDPNVDIRMLTEYDPKIRDFLISKSSPNVKKSITDAINNPKTFKGLCIGKVTFATIATVIAYNCVASLRNAITQRNVEKNHKNLKQQNDAKSFGNATQKNVSFSSSALNFVQSFALDPVRNMALVDLAITSGRLGASRNKYETMEFALSEGSFWLFMYALSAPVAKGLEKISDKCFNKPVSLDIRILTDPDFENYLRNGKLEKDIKQFEDSAKKIRDLDELKSAIKNGNLKSFIDKNQQNTFLTYLKDDNIEINIKDYDYKKLKSKNLGDIDIASFLNVPKEKVKNFEVDGKLDILKFLFDNKNNILTKFAKKTGIVKTTNENSFLQRLSNLFTSNQESFLNKLKNIFVAKSTDEIDTSKYIDIADLTSLSDDLKYFKTKTKDSVNLQNFIKSAQKFKVGSVLGSMAFCCLVLGCLTPNLRIWLRKQMIGSSQFHVANNIEQQIKQEEQKKQSIKISA